MTHYHKTCNSIRCPCGQLVLCSDRPGKDHVAQEIWNRKRGPSTQWGAMQNRLQHVQRPRRSGKSWTWTQHTWKPKKCAKASNHRSKLQNTTSVHWFVLEGCATSMLLHKLRFKVCNVSDGPVCSRMCSRSTLQCYMTIQLASTSKASIVLEVIWLIDQSCI